jgi:hypothetical protein
MSYGLEVACGRLKSIDNYYGLSCPPANLQLYRHISFDEAIGYHIKVDVFQCRKCETVYRTTDLTIAASGWRKKRSTRWASAIPSNRKRHRNENRSSAILSCQSRNGAGGSGCSEKRNRPLTEYKFILFFSYSRTDNRHSNQLFIR